METKKIILPEGWEIDKVEGNEIILKESKSEFPKTWEECIAKVEELECITRNGLIDKVTFIPEVALNHKNDIPKGFGKQLLALCQLLVCREVYRQGWKPYLENNNGVYCIVNANGTITNIVGYKTNHILSFQSYEIMTEFMENFKDLIEEAKELI